MDDGLHPFDFTTEKYAVLDGGAYPGVPSPPFAAVELEAIDRRRPSVLSVSPDGVPQSKCETSKEFGDLRSLHDEGLELDLRRQAKYPSISFSDLPIPVSSEYDLYPEPLRPRLPSHRPSEVSIPPVPIEPPQVKSPSFIRSATSTSSLRSDSKSSRSNKSVKSSKSSKLRSLLSFRSKTASEQSEQPVSHARLPRPLSFCSTASGDAILLWQREHGIIFYMDIRSGRSSCIDLPNALASEPSQPGIAIQHVSAGRDWASIVMIYKRRLHLLLYPLHEAARRVWQPGLYPPIPLPDGFIPKSTAISRTDTALILSSGSQGWFFICNAGKVISQKQLDFRPKGTATREKKHGNAMDEAVQYQALGFCERGERLIVATQDANDSVDIRTWRCPAWDGSQTEAIRGSGQRLGAIRITTGYDDSRGVTVALCSSAQRSAFVAGFSSKSYPSIVPFPQASSTHSGSAIVSNTVKAQHLSVRDTRVRCATSSPSGNFIAFLDSSDIVKLVDLRASGAVSVLGDVRRERRGGDKREGACTLAMPSDEYLYFFCVFDAQPMLVRFDVSHGKEVLDTGQMAREAAAALGVH